MRKVKGLLIYLFIVFWLLLAPRSSHHPPANAPHVPAVDPTTAPELFVSLAAGPEVELARQSLTSPAAESGIPLPPLDPLAVSVLVTRSLGALGGAPLLTPDEAAALLAPVIQNGNAFVCMSVATHVLGRLPEGRKAVLRRLLRYLRRLAAFSATCTAAGMAQCVGPALLGPERLACSGGAQDLTHAAIACTLHLIE